MAIFDNVFIVFAVLLALALVFSSWGFYRIVYFISIGYGFSIAALAIASGFIYARRLAPTSVAEAVILAAYGLRLAIYLWNRETSASFSRTREEIERGYPDSGLVLKVALWVGVSILYVSMISPLVFQLETAGGRPISALAVVGVVVTALGFALEAVADGQKTRAKRDAPDRFCDSGLYRFTRCPNYLGEMLVWLGSFLAGLPFYGSSLWKWAIAAAGFVIIMLVMLGSARRLELSQDGRYGSNEEYRAYARSTPILVPFVPLYSLKNLKVYLG